MASRCTQSRTWRSCQAQKATKRPPGPGGQRAPAPQDEDPRVRAGRDHGESGVAWAPESGFGPGMSRRLHHSLVHSHPKAVALGSAPQATWARTS